MCLASQWLQRPKSNKQSRCLSRNGPANRRGQHVPWVRLGPLAVLWVFLFFKPEAVSASSWGFPKPYSSGSQASSDIISEWCGAERLHEVIRGNTSMIAGSERAGASVARKTRQTFWNSAWHSVGIKQSVLNKTDFQIVHQYTTEMRFQLGWPVVMVYLELMGFSRDVTFGAKIRKCAQK